MSVSFRSFVKKCGCRTHVVELDREGRIGGSVGAGGGNGAIDTRTVQALLNGIGPLEGGPSAMLAVDGIVGPKTIGAITGFQATQFGWSDGRVDPNGQTIKLLREPPALPVPIGAGPGPVAVGLDPERPSPSRRPAQKDPLPAPPKYEDKFLVYAQRLATAVAVFPDAKAAVDSAIQRLNNAIRWAQASHLKAENDTVAHVHKHFRTGKKHSSSLIGDLKSLQHVYRMINVVMNERIGLFGGTPWGTQIFDIDRFPNLNKGAAAYTGLGAMHVPSNRVDRRYNHPIMGSTVYLCDGSDNDGRDAWIMTVVHEIAHMVGSRTEGAGIDDYGYSWEARYNGLGKWHRMHNAENYCVYAFESKFGTARLRAAVANEDFLIAPVVKPDGSLLN